MPGPLQQAYPARPTGIATGLTAAGTNQGTATPLPLRNGLVEVATVAGGTGVILPVIAIPGEILIRNAGSATLTVYPQPGGTIDRGTINAGTTIAPGSSALFWASSGANWYVMSGAGAGGGGLTIGGSSGQVQYNNGGLLGGAAAVGIGAGGQLNLAEIATPGTQVSGDRWTDTTQHCMAEFDGSATSANCLSNYRVGLIYTQGFGTGGTANVTVTATGEQTLIDTSNGVGTLNLPAAYLNVKGRMLRIRVLGFMSTIASAPGNHFVLLKFGTNYVATTAATALGTSKVNNAFIWEAMVITKATGASGKIDISGAFTPLAGSTGAVYSPQGFMNSTSSTGSAAGFLATPITLDLTAAYTLGLFNNFSVGGTGNSITVTHILVEVIA